MMAHWHPHPDTEKCCPFPHCPLQQLLKNLMRFVHALSKIQLGTKTLVEVSLWWTTMCVYHLVLTRLMYVAFCAMVARMVMD